MEHRLSERRPAQIEALLYHNGIPVAACKTCDISQNGVYLQTGPLRFHKNSALDVEFITSDSSKTTRCRMAGIVVHSSPDGLGLMFMEPDGKQALQLEAMLESYETQVDDLPPCSSAYQAM